MRRNKGINIERRYKISRFKSRTRSRTKTLASATIALWTCMVWTSASISSGSARCWSVANSVWAGYTWERLLTICLKTVSIARITSSVASAGWCSALTRSTSTWARGCADCSGVITGSGASFVGRMWWRVIWSGSSMRTSAPICLRCRWRTRLRKLRKGRRMIEKLVFW